MRSYGFVGTGGINEQFLAALRADGVPRSVHNGLDDVLARVRGQ